MQVGGSGVSRARDLGLAFFIALALCGLSAAWKNSAASMGIDFYQDWVVGQALRESTTTNIYASGERLRLGGEYWQKARRNGGLRYMAAAEFRQNLETYSSPLLYSVLSAFGTGDFETDFRDYTFFLIVCFGGAVILFARTLDYSWSGALAAVAFFCAWFAPFGSDLRVGNVSSIQLAAVALFLWTLTRMRWRFRDVLGGLVIGLAVAFKPNLVFVPCVVAVNWLCCGQAGRLGRLLAGAGLAAGAAFLIVAATFHSFHCWFDWISTLRSLPEGMIAVRAGNFALSRMIFEWIGIQIGWALALALGGAVAARLWMGRRSYLNDAGAKGLGYSETLAVSCGCLLVVLAPKLAWEHYYVLTVLPLLVVLRPPDGVAPATLLRPFLVVLALLALALDPVYPLMLLSPAAPGVLLVTGSLFLLGLLLLAPARTVSGGAAKSST